MPRITKLLIIAVVALAATPACFVRRRAVTPTPAHQSSPLLAATKEELIRRLHDIADPIQSFVMTADLSPSVLEPSKGTATDYATVSSYVLFRKPDDIRILGRDPVIGSTIFDMVSDGKQFSVSIPPKKRYIIGTNNAPEKPGSKLENLRPEALLTSLIIYPPDNAADITLLENDNERALYILLIIRHNQDQFTLARQVYFDGRTLQAERQKTFDMSGGIVSDTKYSGWKGYDSASFPSEIDIQRPKDNYEVQLTVVNIRMNSPDVTADKFVLKQPPDFQVQELK